METCPPGLRPSCSGCRVAAQRGPYMPQLLCPEAFIQLPLLLVESQLFRKHCVLRQFPPSTSRALVPEPSVQLRVGAGTKPPPMHPTLCLDRGAQKSGVATGARPRDPGVNVGALWPQSTGPSPPLSTVAPHLGTSPSAVPGLPIWGPSRSCPPGPSSGMGGQDIHPGQEAVSGPRRVGVLCRPARAPGHRAQLSVPGK